MNKASKLLKDLPNMEHEFSIDIEGGNTKRKYAGNFKFRIPNNKQKAMADKLRAGLNEGLEDQLDPSTVILHYMIAFLRYSLINYPEWWKDSDYGYELHDFNVVKEVYTKSMDFQEEWLKEVWGEDFIKQDQEEDEKEGKEK